MTTPRVGIVTDSAASLPGELAKRWGVVVVDLAVEGEATSDRGRQGRPPKSAAPPPGRFAEAIESADAGGGVVVLTVASALSGTCSSARVAAQMYRGPVAVVDTLSASGGQALVVAAAASAAARGAPLEVVRAAAEESAAAVRLVATVDSLEHLRRSGRVPQAAGWAGEVLGVRPLFTLAQGAVKVLRPVIGEARATSAMVAQVHKDRAHGSELHLAVLHAGDPQGAKRLAEHACRAHSPATSFIAEAGEVIVAHTGLGVRGLAWWWRSQAT